MRHDSKFSAIWSTFEIFCCLTSSYIYAWVSCFGTEGGISYDHLHVMIIVYELIFFLSIVKKFITDYIPDGETNPVKDLGLIRERYFKQDFWVDIITWFPIVFFFDTSIENYYRLLFLIKIIRLLKGFKIFSVPLVMDRV